MSNEATAPIKAAEPETKDKKNMKKNAKKAAPAKAAKAAPAKKAAKKAAKVAPAKKAAKKAAKAAPAKKAAAAPASASGSPFREGSTKAQIFDVLRDGKPHKKEDLRAICDDAGKTHQLISFVLRKLRNIPGYKIVQDRETLQVTSE